MAILHTLVSPVEIRVLAIARFKAVLVRPCQLAVFQY